MRLPAPSGRRPTTRLRAADRSVDLGYFGVINQTTGEDWNKVKLTLSTARPSLGGGARGADALGRGCGGAAASHARGAASRAGRGERSAADGAPEDGRAGTGLRRRGAARAAARSGDSGNRRGPVGRHQRLVPDPGARHAAVGQQHAARGHHHGQTAGDAPIPIHAVAARGGLPDRACQQRHRDALPAGTLNTFWTTPSWRPAGSRP